MRQKNQNFRGKESLVNKIPFLRMEDKRWIKVKEVSLEH